MRCALLVVLALAVGCSAGNDEDGEGVARRLRADFSVEFVQPATGPTSCPVTQIRFRDRSTGGPTSWHWTFEDGSTSTKRNPTLDSSSVVAEATLRVSRGEARDSVTKQVSTYEC
jgi:PKD repeat protein